MYTILWALFAFARFSSNSWKPEPRRCNPFLHEKGESAPTRIIVQIPLTECSLLEHESLRQRFFHAGLLKAREYAWPEVAQRITNYYQELLDERGSSSMRPRSRAL